MAINKEYDEFIISDQWQELRKQRIKIAKNKCENCLKYKPLQVHHKTYERFGGDELMDDLLALCFDCHEEFDMRRKSGLSQDTKKWAVETNKYEIRRICNYCGMIFEDDSVCGMTECPMT